MANISISINYTVIQGDVYVRDETQRIQNINSFNNTSSTIANSFNDASTAYVNRSSIPDARIGKGFLIYLKLNMLKS